LIVRAAVGAATRGVWVERWPQGDGTVLAFAALLDRLVDGGAAALGPAPAPTETHPEAFGQALAAYADGVVARLSERPRRHSALLILERSGAAPVLAVLDALTRSRGGLPFAVAARATEPGDGPAIALGPLDGAALGAFVSRRFGPIAGAERLVDHLRATTGGHPGTLVAMAELLVARGVIALGEEGWRLDRGLEAFVPPEVSALMEARIATWPEAARDLLEVWRALDVPLDLAALDALTRAEPGALDLLVATGMIRADGGRFALVPSVRRATPLPSALKERISRYSDFEHLDFRLKSRVLGGEAGLAELLTPIREALAEFRLDDAEQWSALGLELLDGRPGEGGLALLSLRVDIADRRGPREAQRDALRRLGEALPEGDPRALEVRSRLFWALTRMGDPSFEAEGRGVRARALAAGRTLLAAEIGVHLAIAKTQCGAWDEAEGLLLEARAALPEARGALALSARIANNLGNVQSYRGAFEAAAEAYREALAHKLEEGDPVGERIARGNLALMELELGRPGLALAGLHRSLALARQTGHRRGEAWCLLTLAEVGVEAGALRYAMRRARRAAEVAAELGDRLVEGDAWTTLAEARWLAGEPHAEAARRGLALAELAGSAWTRARARLLVAMADGGADGETTLEALEALVAEDTADPTTRRMAARILAERALVRGDTAAALSGLRQALSWSGGGRPGLRHAAFEATVLRAFEVARDAELGSRRAKLEAALARFVEGLPEAPRAEDDDPEAVYDGPSRRGASKALAAHSSRAVDDRGVPALNGAGGWGVSGVDTVVRSEAGALLTRTLGAFVRAVEAERAVVIVFTEAGAELLASCDADGEAVPDALKRLPEVVLEAARRDVCWRASGEGGALAVWPWRQPVGAGESSVALCAQNRFREHAFADLELGTRSAEPVKLVARLALVERALAMAEDAVKRAQAQVIRVERESTAEINSLRRELESTREQLGPAHAYRDILFTSDAMKRMLRQVDRVVGTDLSVHIHGESGTGKELIARAIHDLGARRGGPFVPQNCTAIPQTLFESELFGHERGSFTGAVRASEGLFRRAHRGTLFLDEIGDLPLELQAKLLRVLETGEVRPVGATKSVEVDVRIVSATHRDLGDLIKRGLFREDLYYRLNVIRIEVPPLRDRPDDIPLLVKHFLTQRGEAREIDPRAMRALVRYGWPGNVRQLENEVARASLLAGGDRIVLEDLSPDLAASKPDTHVATDAKRAGALSDFGLDRGPLKDRVDRLEAHALTTALAEAAQNKSEVARVLGLSRAGLNLKLKRLGLWEGDS
jgi:DNA-binding NtrC family response regulator/tetratricopeptide (TPR) repeat protein